MITFLTENDPTLLFYISAASLVICVLISVTFPRFKEVRGEKKAVNLRTPFLGVMKLGMSQIVALLTEFRLIFVSVWIFLSFSVNTLVVTYWQTLFQEIDSSHDYFGIINAVSVTFAAYGTFISGELRISERLLPLLLLATPFLSGICLILLPLCGSIVMAALVLTVFRTIFESMLPQALAEVARSLKGTSKLQADISPISVISLNLFVTFLIQVVIQAIFNQSIVVVSIQTQFLIYALLEFFLVYILCFLLLAFVLIDLKFGRGIGGRGDPSDEPFHIVESSFSIS